MKDLYIETLLLVDWEYRVNTDYETFYNNVWHGSDYLKAMNFITKLS